MSPPIPNSPAGSPPLVRIPVGEVQLDAELDVPPGAHGLVIFAHGTGSGRLSPRNSAVAQRLRTHALATLLVDLLTAEEDIDREKRFDIQLLTERLGAITDWAQVHPDIKKLPIGYFGASTGAAAALNAAANRQKTVRAVVSRGGRVDLARESLASLKTPTLFAVGQNDFGVLEVNEEAFLEVPGTKELAIIPHATHLFEEPGTLDRVAQLAAEWFNEYLGV
ncbi:MAG TPA: alpha/beta family hydrolase [Candidatus Pristimantibacillus sp.]|nr:alpha/beta family hydrolase [Candidatus Pristimantibacillus sp.]